MEKLDYIKQNKTDITEETKDDVISNLKENDEKELCEININKENTQNNDTNRELDLPENKIDIESKIKIFEAEIQLCLEVKLQIISDRRL